jgi:anthranilate phosphoribosyltransferase
VEHLKDGHISQYDLLPEDVGLRRAGPADIGGGDAERNAVIIKEILGGAPGPRRDVVRLNAAAAFLVAGKARDWKDGLEMAQESIDSGRAREKLNQIVAFSARCGVYQHKDVS